MATLIRMQAAYIERQGQTVDWGYARTERLIDAYERRLQERADGS